MGVFTPARMKRPCISFPVEVMSAPGALLMPLYTGHCKIIVGC
ncbi:MAG: hypothetical protein QXS79_01580 [Candidatus Bathyarchaeia archaeon]